MDRDGGELVASSAETRILAYRVLAATYVLFLGGGATSRLLYEGMPWWLSAPAGLLVGLAAVAALWRLGGDDRPLTPAVV